MPHVDQVPLNSRLYLDENFLGNELCDAEIGEQLRNLLEVFREFNSVHRGVMLAVDYWDIVGGASALQLYDILFQKDAQIGIPEDELRELQRYFDMCLVDRAAAILVTAEDGEKSLGYTSGIYSVASRILLEESVYPVLISALPAALSGSGYFVEAETRTPCFFYAEKSDFRKICRALLMHSLPVKQEFQRICVHAFPELLFHEDVDPHDFDLPLDLHMATVVAHLSFLNDKFLSIAADVNWDMVQMVANARSHGVEFSDESDRTKRDKAKMKQRDCVFSWAAARVTLTCSWHTKLLWNKGRIHFHGPKPHAPNKVIIGRFHAHLDI